MNATNKTSNAFAAQALAQRATLKQKSEARDRAAREQARLSGEQPRLRQALADSGDLVKKAKVAELLDPGAAADAELADARKKHDATAALVDEVEEKLSLLSTIRAQLDQEVTTAKEQLKVTEDALVRDVLKRRAEGSTPMLRQIAAEIQLLLSFSGTVGTEAMFHEMRRRLEESGRPVHEGNQELRQKILAEEGAL